MISMVIWFAVKIASLYTGILLVGLVALALAKFENEQASLEFLSEVEGHVKDRNLSPATLIPYCKSQVGSLEKKH